MGDVRTQAATTTMYHVIWLPVWEKKKDSVPYCSVSGRRTRKGSVQSCSINGTGTRTDGVPCYDNVNGTGTRKYGVPYCRVNGTVREQNGFCAVLWF